jgi:DNA-binding MarR family transcriptional regulator
MNYLDIIFKLRKIIRAIHLESKKIEKEFGISIPQLLVLQFLSKQETYKATSKEIKEYINWNASTVSGIIDRLEQKGLIARLPNLDDKRRVYIILTAHGAELLKRTPLTLEHKLKHRLSKLSADEIKELESNIDLLCSILDANPE